MTWTNVQDSWYLLKGDALTMKFFWYDCPSLLFIYLFIFFGKNKTKLETI